MKDDVIYRQAAIDAMCSACGYDCDKSEFVYDAPQDEQVILCPEHYALTVLPPAQPEDYTELKREFLRMASYIDALLECSNEQKKTLMEFISRLAEFMPWTKRD